MEAGRETIQSANPKAAELFHHGEIGVDNPDGGGCRFWFTLPA
jgi:hypothetical protein